MPSPPNNLLASPGLAYSNPVAWSHYNEPLVTSRGRVAGNSRIWGDASTATQTAAIDAIIQAAAAHNLNSSDTALLLSIVRHESGFNPDAAAGTTSASGLGQFTDTTGAEYGITAANRWNVTAQAKATVSYFIASQNAATKAGLDSGHIYAFWHDGINSGGNGAGVKIAKRAVMPDVGAFKTYLESKNFGLAGQHSTIPQRASGLADKTPAETARGLASQTGVHAAQKPLSAHERLHGMLMKLSPELPHRAPRQGRAGAGKSALPPRGRKGGVAGLPGAAGSPPAFTAEGETMRLLYSGGDVSGRSFAPVGRGGQMGRFGARDIIRAGGHSGKLPAAEADGGTPHGLHANGGHEAAAARERAGATPSSTARASAASFSQTEFDQKMDDYFFQQSRLAPNGGAAFNPLLSPLWAGLKLPG